MINENEIFDGFAGGMNLPEEDTRKDISESQVLIVSSSLDKQIARLLILHPGLVDFRNNNLASLDAPTKLALLEDMRDSLGIVPLNNLNEEDDG